MPKNLIEIKKPRKNVVWPHFGRMYFVCKALSKDQVRLCLCYLKVEKDGWIVATDGHRLHRYLPAAELRYPAGLYQPLIVTRSRIVLVRLDDAEVEKLNEYPDYTRVMASEPVKDHVDEMFMADRIDDHSRWSSLYARLCRYLHDGCTIRYQYMVDLYGSDVDVMSQHKTDENPWGPVNFFGRETHAVLMPLRVS